MTGDELRQRLTSAGPREPAAADPAARIPVQAWGNGPGEQYPEHRHDYDKVLVCDEGSITFMLAPGTQVLLAAGDRLDLPASTGHAALVGPQGVRCLEAHLPAGSLAVVSHQEGWAAELRQSPARTGGSAGA